MKIIQVISSSWNQFSSLFFSRCLLFWLLQHVYKFGMSEHTLFANLWLIKWLSQSKMPWILTSNSEMPRSRVKKYFYLNMWDDVPLLFTNRLKWNEVQFQCVLPIAYSNGIRFCQPGLRNRTILFRLAVEISEFYLWKVWNCRKTMVGNHLIYSTPFS